MFRIVSFDLPQCVEVSAFSSFVLALALVVVFFMCGVNVSFVSKVRPSIFGCCTVGSVMLSAVSASSVLYSAGSGVNSVVAVFVALSVSWLFFVHV